jgi:segregation and condensation protein B
MELELVLESVLFAAQKPLSPRELRDVLKNSATAQADAPADSPAKAFEKTKEDEIVAALEALQRIHADSGRTFRLACIGGSWQFVSQPEFAPWIMALVGQKPRPPRLTQPALETLTIIAYRQPITRAEMEQIRGVAVDGVMGTLVERGLVVQAGRAEVIGRPMMYATTPLFLEYFGLRSLADLPSADELRKIPVTRPAKLETVETAPEQPDLAVAPPAELTGEISPAAAETQAPTDGGAAPGSSAADAGGEDAGSDSEPPQTEASTEPVPELIGPASPEEDVSKTEPTP